MKRIHREILRMLPGPLLGWLGTFMFLLVMQFLIRHLPDLVGRGLPVSVIFEIVIYNLAYMVVLAVPMSVLIATLMSFGRLAESNAYTVLKSSGVSLLQLIWPALIVGVFLTACMWHFNSEVLPAANYRASMLWKDIRKKRPGFELNAGVFYEGIDDYSILVREIPPDSNDLYDVTIYDYSDGARQQMLIKATRGRLLPFDDGNKLDLLLEDGEIHRILSPLNRTSEERYERLAFGKHRLSLDLSEFAFERSNPRDGYRSDRTMRSRDMIRHVDSLEMSVAKHHENLVNLSGKWIADSSLTPEQVDKDILPHPMETYDIYPSERVALQELSKPRQREIYEAALNTVRATRSTIDNTRRSIEWEVQRSDKYRVEIHKKYSIAVACFIFVLIGAPLGLSIRRGGFGAVGAAATVIFMFYWVTLVQGEKLADRGMLIPWVGMWGANIVMSIVGVLLVSYVILDVRARRLREPGSGESPAGSS